ncbi:MAG: hypothetical protein M0R33_11085 [Methylomonas sp.]|jgi:uncharacterized membrane protein HdeD (DUF308 family)|uniref:HdeD family acid-resistance protein n=1 Tax=Methylomonas sp. TaxID=418 RepID=UPI0025D246E8|nr:hypothetical protein [Methylomonas sp.]MCK9606976.1 hypothetical protein [Methylomonas sp.]
MSQTDGLTDFDHFLPQRNTLFVRGLVLTVSGGLLTLFSLLIPDVRIMFQNSSWLPMVAIVILASGAFSCLDAVFWRHTKEFYTNLQIAVLDSIVGIMLLTELNKPADKLIMLAAAYLMIKGLFRVFAGYAVHFSHFNVAIFGGMLSVFLGILLWQEWPLSSMWFICFCLSIDIFTRGWALTRFGVWLKAQNKLKKPSPLI